MISMQSGITRYLACFEVYLMHTFRAVFIERLTVLVQSEVPSSVFSPSEPR